MVVVEDATLQRPGFGATPGARRRSTVGTPVGVLVAAHVDMSDMFKFLAVRWARSSCKARPSTPARARARRSLSARSLADEMAELESGSSTADAEDEEDSLSLEEIQRLRAEADGGDGDANTPVLRVPAAACPLHSA